MKNLLLILLLSLIVKGQVALSVENDEIWKALYGAEAVPSSGDSDGDGVPNFQEMYDGTDPFDAAHFFNPFFREVAASEVLLTWDSIRGVRYVVEEAESLRGDSWKQVSSEIVGSGEMMSFTVERSNGRSFYRIKVFDGLSQSMLSKIQSHVSDYDGDEIDDFVETSANLNPIKPNALSALSVYREGTEIIEWQSVLGKVYQLQSKSSLSSEWRDEDSGILGTGEAMTVVAMSILTGERSLRLIVKDVDSDGDGLTDWAEGVLGLNPHHVATDRLGNGDLSYAEGRLGARSSVEVIAGRAVANISTGESGSFIIRRTGGYDAIEVTLILSGTAQPGLDYESIPSKVSIPFGVDEVELLIKPTANSSVNTSESILVELSVSDLYELGESKSQDINLIRENSLNVKDFGAVGDGVSDDTLALQAALDALELSRTHNSIFFPAGIYRVNQYTSTPHHTGTSWNRILKLGDEDLRGRDIVFKSVSGAEIISTVSPVRAKILLLLGSFRTVEFRNVNFSKDAIPLSATGVGVEPNGAAGVAVVDIDDRIIESVTFRNCSFINCHRSVTIDTSNYSNNGKLKQLNFYDCDFLNPYGANTIDGSNSYGGGQQVYVSSWVRTARYIGNYFDGEGDSMTEFSNPGLVRKDGSHFGSPLSLVFRENIVRRMGLEAVDQTNDHNKLGNVASAFTVPVADGLQSVTVKVNFNVADLKVGNHINFRQSSVNTILRIVSLNVEDFSLNVVNDGFESNVSPGEEIKVNAQCYIQEAGSTHVEISNNVLEDASYGIVVNAYGEVSGNALYDSSIMSYLEYRSPLYPADEGLLISNNFIFIDNSVASNSYRNCIATHGPNHEISHNVLTLSTGKKCRGILSGGEENYIHNNVLRVEKSYVNGYSSDQRSIGVSLFGDSVGSVIEKNHTEGFDVGVGPDTPYRVIPHTVIDHESVNDQLAVDPRGLMSQ